jgi:tetratricopeptide (TPR) repeat protein
MALLLQRQQAYRPALQFWELALELVRKETSPMLIAEMLREIGESYCHIGLTDHAVIPLQAALKILDKTPEHPWRNATLLTLGNSLRKSSPTEAEKYYREAAESHASRLQYVSAAPAWVNLGILCSEQGRYVESLEFYHKVLQIRERDSSTPPDRIAGLHNNIANCYRRMKSFDNALVSVDRAIGLYPPADPKRAYAFSTRAMTLRDAGRDEEAVEWFRKAIDERRRQPSPSFEAEADDLQGMIDALKRLGRNSEIPAVEHELDALQNERKSIQAAAQTADEFTAFTGGSVFVEVPIGSTHADAETREEIRRLVYALHAEVMNKQVGKLGGHITTPENRTFIFTGADAERLFEVIEPQLASSVLCAGSQIIIRQGDSRREVHLPQHPTAVN